MNQRQQQFLEEYRKDFNGAAAARRMGYKTESARSVAHQLLQSPEIRQELDRAARAAVPEERVLAELVEVALAPGSDENGSATKLASKLRALELLGKHMGLFEGTGGRKPDPVTIIEDI